MKYRKNIRADYITMTLPQFERYVFLTTNTLSYLLDRKNKIINAVKKQDKDEFVDQVEMLISELVKLENKYGELLGG